MKLKCKNCGNEDLFYVKEKYSESYDYVVNYLREETDYNSGIYDNATSNIK